MVGDRVRQEMELDPLLLRVVDLLDPGGHLLLRAAVDEVHVLRPIRFAVRAASIATFPPPTTATFVALFSGVSDSGKRYAFIRFARVRYSFAE